MDESVNLVGRLAQLCNLVSKPGLNEAYVLVQTFLPGRNRFSVRTMPPPNAEYKAVTIAVKQESLYFILQANFYEKYPCPAEVHIINLNSQTCQINNGTVLKLNNLQSSVKPLSLGITLSHRIAGKKAALDIDGIPHPTTTIVGNVHVSADDEDGIVEFEDILFTGHPSLVTCTRGRNITFRRCSFQNAWVTVCTGKDPFILNNPILLERGMDKVVGSPNVVFENCLFEADPFSVGSYGVYAGCDGTVTLLNCVIKNYRSGALVGPNGRISLTHCTIRNCQKGIGAMGKILSLDLRFCTIAKIEQSGIDLDMTGHAVISACRVMECARIGITLCGTSKHTCRVNIDDCHIAKCGDGVSLQLGKVSVSIASSFIRNNIRYGLSILPGVVGRVELSHCHVVENHTNNIVNHSGAECTFLVDDTVQTPLLTRYEPPAQLNERRCYQQAGFIDIRCTNCTVKEEAGEKFKKCGKCENVCYCSRECQKAHWKEHKTDCVPILSNIKL